MQDKLSIARRWFMKDCGVGLGALAQPALYSFDAAVDTRHRNGTVVAALALV